MRSLDPLLPHLFPYWPFKKCPPPHNNKTCLTIVNVVPLVFSIPDDEDCSQAGVEKPIQKEHGVAVGVF